MKTPQLFFEQISLREKQTADLRKSMRPEISDEEVARKIAALEKSNDEILGEYTPDQMKAAVQRKMETRTKRPLKFTAASILNVRNFSIITAAAACLALAFIVSKPDINTLAQSLNGAGAANGAGILAGFDHAKGDGPRMYIYVKDGDQALQLDNNSLVHENDVLQISYVAAGQQYGIILSIDGKGTITQHFPDDGASAVKLDNTGEIALPFSYKLDDAPSFERFFFITGNKPFTVASFMENIRMRSQIGDLKSADLSHVIPMNTRLYEITLLK